MHEMNKQVSAIDVQPRLPLRGTSGQGSTVNGQRPFIPYARQWIDEEDIQAVVEVLHSDWLTTGPKVAEFEKALADFVEAKKAIAVNSGTAALHAAMYAIGIGPGDEVILPPMTFVATANAVVFQGGIPIFADVDPDTLLIDPAKLEEKITKRTKAIVAVDYAGQPCDYDALQAIAARHGLILIADACHALGAEYRGRKVGTLADLTVFSFHPVKHITTGEGGMITTNDPALAERMRLFRNHGITRDPGRFTVHGSPFTVRHKTTSNQQFSTDHGPRSAVNGQRPTDNGQRTTSSWYYEMQDLGYNYRITDIQCVLGLSQLKKLPRFLERRQAIANRYDEAFSCIPEIIPLSVRKDVLHAYHLYVIKVDYEVLKTDRTTLFQTLHEQGIGVNVHYIPVHLHPFYRETFSAAPGLCPAAEAAYEQIISLPMFPGMTDEDVEKVITSVMESVNVKHGLRKQKN